MVGYRAGQHMDAPFSTCWFFLPILFSFHLIISFQMYNKRIDTKRKKNVILFNVTESWPEENVGEDFP